MTTYRASSVVVSAGVNNTNAVSVTPALPTGTADDTDRVFIFASGAGTLATPTGWSSVRSTTSLGSGTYGAAAGVRNMAVFYRNKDSSWTTMPAITSAAGPAANVVAAYAVTVTKTSSEIFDSPTNGIGSDATAASPHSITTAQTLTTKAGSVIMAGTVFPSTTTTATPTLTQTGATIGSVAIGAASAGTTSGNDIAMSGSQGVVSVGATAVAISHSLVLGTARTGGTVVVVQSTSAMTAPAPNAGADGFVQSGTTFTRTAQNTATGVPTTHSWQIMSGPVTGVIGTAAALSWTPATLGTYVIRYTGTNAQGSGFDEITVYVTTTTPTNLSTLTEDFTNPLDSTKWAQMISGGGTSSGQLLMTGNAHIRTINPYVYDQLIVKATIPATGSANVMIRNYVDGVNHVGFLLSGTGTHNIRGGSEGSSGIDTFTWPAGTEIWIRIQSGTQNTFSYSADGVNWTTHPTTIAFVSQGASVYLEFSSLAATWAVDNVNLPPTPTVTYKKEQFLLFF